VLAIIPSGYVYGLQNITLSLFERLSSRTESHFLITRWSDGEFARKLDSAAIPYTYSWLGMFSRRMDWRNLKMTIHCASKLPKLYYDFLRVLRTYRPDVIYAANYHELILLLPLLFFLKAPVVCHMHDPPPSSPFYKASFRLWGQVVNHFIAISRSVQTRMERLGVQSNRVSLLHNGIDLTQFECVEKRSDVFTLRYGWPSESVIVGMTGQMTTKKGHLDLLRAAQIVCRELSLVRFVIGGKELQPYYGQLKDYIKKNDLVERIALSGWQADVREFFAGIDVFAFPSRHEEGFGLVAGEAMATGLPVVTTPSGGAVEIVDDGKTGIVVPKESPPELARAICFLARSPATRELMGKEGRRRIELHFDVLEQARGLETILTKIAARYGN
jgi:glycosyltransferase involved in cell wall biosynthesis